MGQIFLVGTADTKGAEIAFLYERLTEAGQSVVRVDVGTRKATTPMDVPARDVAARHSQGAAHVLTSTDRGHAVSAMSEAFAMYCRDNRSQISGVVGLGGGGGTSIVTRGMRELDYGIPKVMISTLASGDVAPYIDVSDIAMFPSVTDIAGLNKLSREILANAAGAIAGMVSRPKLSTFTDKPAVGMTMFGVTTDAVTNISARLSGEFDCQIFHATGTGGRAMERLVEDGFIDGLIDITLTEVCDLLCGGVLPCTNQRLDVVARTGVPYIGSVGALDMVNFWAPDTVPEAYANRLFYHHNSNVTLMRTTADEAAEIGQWIGRKLNACNGQVRLLIPEKGISTLDTEGGPFFDPEADCALFGSLQDTIRQTSDRQIIALPHHINDPEFAEAASSLWFELQKG